MIETGCQYLYSIKASKERNVFVLIYMEVLTGMHQTDGTSTNYLHKSAEDSPEPDSLHRFSISEQKLS